jgi:hypothetical protein
MISADSCRLLLIGAFLCLKVFGARDYSCLLFGLLGFVDRGFGYEPIFHSVKINQKW